MNKERFEDYADKKNQIKVLTDQLKVMGEEITKEMNDENLSEVDSDFGKFYFTTRKTYSYPEYVIELEKTYKNKKKESELNGDAKFIESDSLTFRSKNE